ncbi:MAG TPA: hypothetical protein V6C89_09140 [Drouetiella sp.]|jgi:hypothetical protein
MQDFDTTTDEDTAAHESEECHESNREKFRAFAKGALKKFVLFLSFGPGVLGFLWLLGRILKR